MFLVQLWYVVHLFTFSWVVAAFYCLLGTVGFSVSKIYSDFFNEHLPCHFQDNMQYFKQIPVWFTFTCSFVLFYFFPLINIFIYYISFIFFWLSVSINSRKEDIFLIIMTYKFCRYRTRDVFKIFFSYKEQL